MIIARTCIDLNKIHIWKFSFTVRLLHCLQLRSVSLTQLNSTFSLLELLKLLNDFETFFKYLLVHYLLYDKISIIIIHINE